MSELKATPRPWVFERMESAEEFAQLQGKTLEEHEGYYRDNNGDWIVTFRDPDDDMGGRIAAVAFKGKAKRGETYKAPDPIGMANARLIAAAPSLYEACVWAEAALAPFSKEPAEKSGIALLRAAIALARGESV